MKKILFFIFTVIAFANIHAQVTEKDIAAGKQLVANNATLLGLSASEQQNAVIAGFYTTSDGVTMVHQQQSYLGVPVYNQFQVVAFKNGKAVSNTGGRLKNIDKMTKNATALPSVSAVSAVQTALSAVKETPLELAIPLTISPDGQKFEFGKLGVNSENIKVELLWYQVEETSEVRLVWQVFVTPVHLSEYWLIRVDAVNNTVIGRTNLTITCQWNHDNHSIEKHMAENRQSNPQHNRNFVAVDNSAKKDFSYRPSLINSATYRVVKYPAESPIHPGGVPSLHTDPWTMAPGNATSLKWNSDPSDYNSTRGNNVYAQEDRDNNNNTFGLSATSSTTLPDLTFDYVYDFTKSPTDPSSDNQKAAIVNLFYWNNIIHDIAYVYGFDEAAANFQNDNQGRGGLGNDYVIADAQDGGGTNNANFSTPSDGSRPRMQMYLWTAPNPDRDGDMDNSIVVHEYTHGISNRLTGGPSTASCLSNAEQAGEGWSDYFALMSTTDWSTATVNDGALRRGIGTYALNQPINGTGIRRFPYSTDMSIYPLTYANMPTSVRPHGTGEIWCMMIWEMTWAIIQQDNAINPNLFNPGPTTSMIGNSAALKLVVEGMRLQPCNPGYVDSRDAILKADTLFFNSRYSCTIWAAFAKRGLGRNASQGSAGSTTDGIADFTVDASVFTLRESAPVVQEGQTVTYTNTVTAGDCGAISNFFVTDTLPTNVTYVSGGSYNAANRVVTFSPISLAAGQSQNFPFTVTVNNGTYFTPVEHINETVASSSIPAAWTISPASGTTWGVSSAQSHSSPNAFFVPNPSVLSDIRLSTSAAYTLSPVSVSNYTTFSFWHSFNTEEGWDGGVVEISTNNGSTWVDLESKMIAGKYNGSLGTGSNNPIGGRSAFTGSTAGFIQTIINLSSYAGQSVMIRFRFASDDNTAPTGGGWYVDDITITSEPAVQIRSSIFNGSGVRQSYSDTIARIIVGCIPVAITNNPLNVNTCSGSTVSYTVTTTGVAPVYQWQVNTGSGFVDLTNTAPYSGVSTSTLTITGVTAGMQGNQYRCIVSNGCTSPITSAAATISVGSVAVVNTDPVSRTICPGVNTSFAVTATGASSYQWQVNTGSGFVNLTNTVPYSGAATATLTITNPSVSLSGNQYRCVLGSCAASVNSAAAVLTISVPVTITSQPASAEVCEKSAHTFTIITTGSVLSYQWQVSTDGGTTFVNLGGATTSTYTIPETLVGQNGYRFRCLATGSCGPVISDAVLLTVNPLPVFSLSGIPAVICFSDQAFLLNATTANGTWSGSGVQGQQFSPSIAGIGLSVVSYSVTEAGCTTIKQTAVQVNECKERQLLLDATNAVYVYPNPNNGRFNIRLNTDLYSRLGVKVFASDGKLVKSQFYGNVSFGTVIPFDLTHMPSGVYQLYIYNDETEFIKKAVSIVIYR